MCLRACVCMHVCMGEWVGGAEGVLGSCRRRHREVIRLCSVGPICRDRESGSGSDIPPISAGHHRLQRDRGLCVCVCVGGGGEVVGGIENKRAEAETDRQTEWNAHSHMSL